MSTGLTLPLLSSEPAERPYRATATIPSETCPVCGKKAEARWDLDAHLGLVKVGDYTCKHCGWQESGCVACKEVGCKSWTHCKGGALYTNLGITNFDDLLFQGPDPYGRN